MEEIRPLLSNQPWEGSDLPSPNLRPRHQELIPTPCGPIKPWSELSCLVKLYFCFTIASLLALLALTLTNIYRQSMATYSYEDDFTVSLIQLVGILFCIYYITRGILQENRQELIVFVLSVLVVMMRSVVNFMVLPFQDRKDLLLVRFVCILCVGVVHVLCATLLIQRPNMMAFRVGGALESFQEQYFLINLCFSMVTFDLQAQLCLCILIMTSGTTMSFTNSIILGFGVVWACLTAAMGAIAVLKEAKPLVWVFVLLNVPEVAYFVYLMYRISVHWGQDTTYTLEAAAVTGAGISVLIKGVLFWSLFRLARSFGQGLRERMFTSDKQ
ncbi:uncharacterized protein isoform X1 [Salmo salar]|uniref:Uncharacterized protein isoform X1 n=1 Tax=Salmo salar TaxID=8030 RepID=A0A1S3MDJ9_SALSA|nr:uncharacterized protein LOC106572000 isoform X1 [Salmo salar]|eukprot:XP_014001155.1 PREDICTED: uncharacterized protein LOC106572000 isoform X1 [Salmo salar]